MDLYTRKLIRKSMDYSNKTNLLKNYPIIEKSGILFEYINKTIIVNTIEGKILFYPTKNKFNFKGKIYYGCANKFIDFISKFERTQ